MSKPMQTDHPTIKAPPGTYPTQDHAAELATLEAILRGTPAEQRRAFVLCVLCCIGAGLAAALIL